MTICYCCAWHSRRALMGKRKLCHCSALPGAHMTASCMSVYICTRVLLWKEICIIYHAHVDVWLTLHSLMYLRVRWLACLRVPNLNRNANYRSKLAWCMLQKEHLKEERTALRNSLSRFWKSLDSKVQRKGGFFKRKKLCVRHTWHLFAFVWLCTCQALVVSILCAFNAHLPICLYFDCCL